MVRQFTLFLSLCLSLLCGCQSEGGLAGGLVCEPRDQLLNLEEKGEREGGEDLSCSPNHCKQIFSSTVDCVLVRAYTYM